MAEEVKTECKDLTEEQVKNLVKETISGLACSQGMYSRLWRDWQEASEEDRTEWCKQFAHCHSSLDVVMQIEC